MKPKRPEPRLRISCWNCDRDDGDGITKSDATYYGWTQIVRSRPIGSLCWWTHLGMCPECTAAETKVHAAVDDEPMPLFEEDA